jgi:CRP-like cAMP-binding protein
MGAHVSQIKQSAVRNRLLAALPPADFERLSASLTLVSLSLKQPLLEADEPLAAAYFIETGMVSYLAYLQGGEAIEVGIIGAEGMVGMPLILGVDSAPAGAIVQMQGTALPISPAALRQAFSESEALRTRLLRYMQALYTQVSQTAVCNERLALALQAGLLLRHAPPPIAEAFCASRLGGEWGFAFGTLPPEVDGDAILIRATGASDDHRVN